MSFTRQFADALRKALRQPPPKKKPARRRRPAAAETGAAAPGLSVDSPEFAERLRGLFKGQSQMVVGGLHVIGISHIKEHFGDQWPRMADRVESIVRSAIERRLTADDLYGTFQESAYIIVFARLPKEAAQLKCAMIAEEISKRVFGERPRGDLIEVATSVVGRDGSVSLDRLKIDSLLAAARGEAMVEVETPEDRKKTQDRNRKPEWEAFGTAPEDSGPNRAGDAGDDLVDPDWQAGEQEAPDAAEWQAATGDDGQDPDWFRFRPELSPQRLEAERRRLAAQLRNQLPARERKLYDRGPLNFVYRPMWRVTKGLALAHTCIPARVTSEGTTLIGGAALLSSPGSPANAEYDTTCLQAVGNEMKMLALHGRRSALVAPVHFISLSDNKLRPNVVAALRALPEEYRNRVLLEILSIPSGTPQGRLEEAVSVARMFCRHVLIRLRLDTRDFTPFAGLGLYAVGCDITNYQAPEDKLIAGFEAFAEHAARVGLRTYAHGLRTTSLVSAAACAGFDYIDGDPVTTVLEEPRDIHPFDVPALYQPLAAFGA